MNAANQTYGGGSPCPTARRTPGRRSPSSGLRTPLRTSRPVSQRSELTTRSYFGKPAGSGARARNAKSSKATGCKASSRPSRSSRRSFSLCLPFLNFREKAGNPVGTALTPW